ncbi:MAG: hypothetical protein M3Z33_07270 [Actinomycetota bacterium]|nr:hypothetical protein [Actinomycetota bacterium]
MTAVAVVTFGLSAHALGAKLGVDLPPFTASYAPAIDAWALPGIAVLLGAVLLAPRVRAATLGPAGFGAAVVLLGLVMRLALNVVRAGPHDWYAVFGATGEGRREYLPALSAFTAGTDAFLRHFAEFARTLPTHPRAHPPGLLVTLHLLGIDSARGMAALTIGVGALTVPLTYLLGRNVLDDGRARTAALFCAFAPASLLYGATSADALYAALATAAAVALVARPRTARAAGAILLLIASFFSYALVAVGAWASLVTLRRSGPAAAVRLAAACAVALLAGYAALHASTGFDVLDALREAGRAYHGGIASVRPYEFWVLGSPTAFLVVLGPPLTWLVLRRLAEGDTTALALVLVVAASALLGFTKAENERIWLFLVPLASIAAASGERVRHLRWLLGGLVVQALAVELLLDTTW